MNIGMFTNTYKPFIGGVPISIERLANGLRSLGHKVYIFAPEYCEYDCKFDNKWIIRVKRLKVKIRGSDFVIPNIFDLNIEKIFKKLNINLIHVHHPFLLGKKGLELGQRYSIPVVCTYHTRYEEYLHNVFPYNRLYKYKDVESVNRFINKTKENFIPSILRKFLNDCDLIIAPTQSIKINLREIGVRCNINVVPTGLTKDSFIKNDIEVEKVKNRYKKDKKYLFCTVARLSKEKNIEFLIDGSKMLKEKIGNSFVLMIMGEGPLRKDLEMKVKLNNLEENIIFLGNIKNNKIKYYYAASDLFLFASKSETQGIVLLEAMTGKTPIIAVEASGVIDIIKNGINGYMTRENLDEWTGKINEILLDEHKMKLCKRGAYLTAINYKEDLIAKLMCKSYVQAIVLSGEEEYMYEVNNSKVFKYNI